MSIWTRRIVCIVLAFLTGNAFACETWKSFKPEIKFQLENGTFRETMAWTSGWSYALTSYVQHAKANGVDSKLCLCEGDSINSKVILDALNKEFEGKTITADQAKPVAWNALLDYYKCK